MMMVIVTVMVMVIIMVIMMVVITNLVCAKPEHVSKEVPPEGLA